MDITRYITSKEIAEIAEISHNKKAREILAKANEICVERGYIVPNKKKAPRDIVLELLGITKKEEEK